MKIEKSQPNTITLAFTMAPEEWQNFYQALMARKKSRVQRLLINQFTDELISTYPEIEAEGP